jgi:branched-chain amino acid transport system permease protein
VILQGDCPLFVQLVVNSIIAGAIYTLLALGFTIIYGTLNFFNMAHGVAYMVGAYLSYIFRIQLGLDLPLAFSLSAVLTAFAMIGVDRIAYFHLRTKRAPSWALVVSSIGVAIFIESLISVIFGSDTRSLRTEQAAPGYSVLGAIITPVQISMLIVSGILMLFLTLFLKMTLMGKALRATSNDPDMSSVLGINTESIYRTTFAVGSALAAIAGSLVALETDVFPTMGHSALLKSIVASIMGGIGNIPGAVFGSFFLGFVENFGIWKLSSGWKDAIALILLMFFILHRPSMFGIESQK